MHAATFDAVEYLPAAHAVHIVAPAAGPVFVIEPALHVAHDESVDTVEYLLGPHSVHVVAPVPLPLFVIEPA